MESMIFGFCLWFVVFSLLCWLITPASVSVPETVTVTEVEKQDAKEQEKISIPSDVIARSAVCAAVDFFKDPKSKDLFQETIAKKSQDSSSVDVGFLSLRELRQVIRALNEDLQKNDPRRIQQKVNKKDVPLDSLRAQVKRG